jgi:hypothetical protein
MLDRRPPGACRSLCRGSSRPRRPKAPPRLISLALLLAVAVVLGRSAPGLGGQGLSQAACPPAPRFTLPDPEGRSRTGGVCGMRVGTAPAEVLRQGLEMVLVPE